ncbi:MAG: 4-diphosphocytidyl-2-C-methyl-D-erythritol kinase [Ignavibacteria bacterium]|nr:MAG: 4-diphosphocytidyl-2-C-methyl-D-erythritol kinase [Ignavibacteria bacterium]KAF0162061.1 MAG: 4-diphosphocytidyl-2-C-methyl-D-erythritol kinase [Ignavibacteria bacterium]
MKFIEIKAHAKINIGLDVLSKREDGFHNLNTLFYPILDLFDTLYFERSDKFEFKCDSKSIPTDSSNLVVKAVKLLEDISGKKLTAKVELHKKIPSQAGLGGGSSDAAATLISLNEMFQLEIKYEQMLELALELGSDVPFFIKAKPAIGKLRGEILEYVELFIEEPILIVNPCINVSTKEAFSYIQPKDTATEFKNLIVNEKLDYSKCRSVVKNDFETPVFNLHPQLQQIKKEFYNQGALFALMSGTGSTMYGIFPDLSSAESARSRMDSSYFCFMSTPHL